MEKKSFFHSEDGQDVDFKDFVLILPAVSVGEIGQLSIDLLISNMEGVRTVGQILHHSILPMIARDAFHEDSQKLCSALEVYSCPEKKLLVFQQRSPFVKGRIPQFRDCLLAWIKEQQISRVIHLSSCSAHVRTDSDLIGSQFRFLVCCDDELKEEFKAKFNWKEFDTKRTKLNNEMEDEQSLHMPGSGITKSLMEDCDRLGVPFVAFVPFSNPGTSLDEVHVVVECVQQWLQVLDKPQGKLAYPISWKYLRKQKSKTPVF